MTPEPGYWETWKNIWRGAESIGFCGISDGKHVRRGKEGGSSLFRNRFGREL